MPDTPQPREGRSLQIRVTEDGAKTLVRVDVFDGSAHSAWWASRSKVDPWNEEDASSLASRIGRALAGEFAQATLF